MNNFSGQPTKQNGFTLVELLTAVAILSLIILTVSQMLIGAQQSIAISRKLLDCDDQARLAFGRMENDFTKIVKRTDVDFIFAKQSGASASTGASDKIFFYSQSVGDNNGNNSSGNQAFPNGVENPVSLIGYTVTTDPNVLAANKPPVDLQRLGRGLNWFNVNSSGYVTDNMVYLTPATATEQISTPAPYFDPVTTLDGHWSHNAYPTGTGAAFNSIGTAPTYSPTTPLDPDWHVLGDQIFRFEYCFLLKDGSYSDYPVEENAANVPSSAVVNGNTVTPSSCIILTPIANGRPPTVNDDNSNTKGTGFYVATGTRWFDIKAGRAYICTNPSKGAAVWQEQGVQDVAAIVVAIAVLDRNTRTLLNNIAGTTAMTTLATQFPDSAAGMTDTVAGFVPAADVTTKLVLMQSQWQTALNSFSTSTPFASAAANHLASANVRLYQRYFYLNSATSL